MDDNLISIFNIREHCPCCHSTKYRTLYSESFTEDSIKKYLDTHYQGRVSFDFDGYLYELAQCQNCTLVYQIYVPKDQLLAEIYDVWIPKNSREQLLRTYYLEYYRYLSEQIQFIIQHFNLPPHEIKVLDFGFGWAEWAKMAMGYGCDVAGSELSQERILYAKSIGLKIIDILALPKNNFHYINTEQVFEHLIEPRELLLLLEATLTINGIIKISVPNSIYSIRKIKKKSKFSSLLPNEIMPIAPLEHINSFDYHSLVMLASTVGLKPLKPSFRNLYNSSSGWLNIRNLIRLIIRPFYRHIYPKSTFVYFVKK
jgi:hypothetical protein